MTLFPLQWSCQVPLILQTVFLYNYAHMMGNTASWLFSRLVAPDSAQQLAERAQVAVATPWALGLTAWARALLQPMARHPVTTLAEWVAALPVLLTCICAAAASLGPIIR